MNDRLHNPMMQNHWSQTLETLIDWLTLNDTLSDAVVVRRLMDVLARAPQPEALDGLHKVDSATVDRLLRADAADALVLRLIGAQSGFLASRGASGEHLVSVVLAGRSTESSAAGTTLARATVCALALALSQPDQADHPPEHTYTGFRNAPAAGATLH